MNRRLVSPARSALFAALVAAATLGTATVASAHEEPRWGYGHPGHDRWSWQQREEARERERRHAAWLREQREREAREHRAYHHGWGHSGWGQTGADNRYGTWHSNGGNRGVIDTGCPKRCKY